jgi:hypothetical protein
MRSLLASQFLEPGFPNGRVGQPLNFRVAHLSRRVTGGDFDFDSRIEESM